MDLSKLKLEKFKTYNGFNLPPNFDVQLQPSEQPDVWFLFVTSFEDVNRFSNLLFNMELPKDNRVFYIYKKGQRSFHRDHIRAYIVRAPFLAMKAPMLCSLNKTYSCFSCMIKK